MHVSHTAAFGMFGTVAVLHGEASSAPSRPVCDASGSFFLSRRTQFFTGGPVKTAAAALRLFSTDISGFSRLSMERNK